MTREETEPPPADNWVTALGSEAVGRVFLHLQEHGSITEAELVGMLGSPRKARRFAVRFGEYEAKVRFSVRTEDMGGTKRYVRLR